MAKLEICCFNIDGAMIAAEAGADRIELCKDKQAAGLTPPLDWLWHVKEYCPGTPVFVMVRPRSGDYSYNQRDLEDMKKTILTFKDYADGFVFGVLNSNKTVAILTTAELVRLAEPLPCTFHRAFDETPSKFQALEDVIATGCTSILTSGGSPLAIEAPGILRMLSEKANGRIDIIAAGGIRFDSVGPICSTSKVPWIHSSALAEGSFVPEATEIKGMLGIVKTKGVKAKEMEAEASHLRAEGSG